MGVEGGLKYDRNAGGSSGSGMGNGGGRGIGRGSIVELIWDDNVSIEYH